MPLVNDAGARFSRRRLLKGLACAPVLLRPAALFGRGAGWPAQPAAGIGAAELSEIRYRPRYPRPSPLEDVLRLVPPGSDEYATEAWAAEIEVLLEGLGAALRRPGMLRAAVAGMADDAIRFTPLDRASETPLRRRGPIEPALGSVNESANGSANDTPIEAVRRTFVDPAGPDTAQVTAQGAARFAGSLERLAGSFRPLTSTEFLVTAIEATGGSPLTARLTVRYDLSGAIADGRREQRVGTWRTEWRRDATGWRATLWEPAGETATRARGGFEDVTAAALGGNPSWAAQLQHGADDWRTTLDGACGIDVYGNNGVAAGDYDGDGFDDLYVCQPAGLPNRLYRNRGDGTFEDVTAKAGVGVLDNSACALFADFRNRGLEDLLVVCGGGPLLFENRGDGTFREKTDAFRFAQAPAGTFTSAAAADYDGDGRLDLYLCVYSYYLGLDQYHYPAPYHDARNGPPNFLLHNNGDGTFTDVTERAGLSAGNNRYSFACAWGAITPGGGPDLYVANDFGRANLYRNNGDGTFTDISDAARVNDAGAGMSACWADTTLSGREDIYAANMWSAAGQRVSTQQAFHPQANAEVLAAYRQHARGNDLYRNQGGARFANVAEQAGAAAGRWSWGADFFDLDHDGYPDLYITNGYISAPDRTNLSSFFWRQVVGRSPDDATPNAAYERGWQAINELIRSDRSWAGRQRNVALASNRDGSFAEISAVVGLDCMEDGRCFALADLDHDGRLEVILKNRNAPQLRILHNGLQGIGRSIALRLEGTRSNRDAIGATVTLECGTLRQTRSLQCGSGFLAQHSKTLLFGLGAEAGAVRATVRWPGGGTQALEGLPPGHLVEVREGEPGFTARPFLARPAPHAAAAGQTPPAQPRASTATWLLQPLQAPRFSLPDAQGALHSLAELRDAPALLCFWSAEAPASLSQLRRFAGSTGSGRPRVLAINVDDAAHQERARTWTRGAALPFPAVFATDETAGIYNLVYRYLFDRRRDLGLPTTLLLDAEGRIVKIYQGAVEPGETAEDAARMPGSEAERMQRALPFPGTLHMSAFRRNDFTYGVAMFQHGYLDEAAAQFERVIAARPDYPEAYYNLGTLHLERRDYDAARHSLEQALKLKPGYPEAWNNLGMIAAEQSRPEEAVHDFQQSLALRPDYATALLNLGNLYRRMGRVEEAERCLLRAVALEPGDAEANYSVGMFYARQNQPAQAELYLEKALALRPGYAEAANNLGVLHVRAQQFDRAEGEFRAAIAANPKFDQPYLNLARLAMMRHDKPRALDALQALLRALPADTAGRQMLDAVNAAP